MERSVSPMPQTKTAPSSTSQAVQTEAVVTAGPKELQVIANITNLILLD